MMQKNTITVTSDKITQPLTFAFAADFHNGDADEALSLMRGCDAILIGGDLVNRHSRHGWRNAARFLNLAPRVAPHVLQPRQPRAAAARHRGIPSFGAEK